jgi:glutaredoxin 3
MFQPITLYSTPTCPYCVSAKELLSRLGYSYQEVDVSNPEDRMALVSKANGRKTVPQIFVGDVHVGGFDDLQALVSQDGLKALVERP